MSAGHNRLAALAGEISEHHRAAGTATREVIRHAIEAGRGLAEAKELVGHGGWLAWLKANVPGISARTAQRYLAAAERGSKNDTVSLFRLRDLARRPARPSLADKATAIREHERRLAEAIVATGAALAAVKARLPPDLWAAWLRYEFGSGPELAAVHIQVFEAAQAGEPFNSGVFFDALDAAVPTSRWEAGP